MKFSHFVIAWIMVMLSIFAIFGIIIAVRLGIINSPLKRGHATTGVQHTPTQEHTSVSTTTEAHNATSPTSTSSSTTQGDTTQIAPTEQQHDQSPHTITAYNISMSLNPGWSKTMQRPHNMPYILKNSNILFSLVNEAEHCALTYATNAQWSNTLKQVAFGIRIHPNESPSGHEFTGDWYVPTEYLNGRTIAFSQWRRQRLEHEFMRIWHYAPYTNSRAFYLYSTDGGAVSERCVSDTRDMLRTTRTNISEHTLAPDSDGYITLTRANAPRTPAQSSAVFVPIDGSALYTLNPPLLSGSAYKMYVTDNAIYYIDDTLTSISAYAPFLPHTSTGSAVHTLVSPQSYIADIYLTPNTIYYLTTSERHCLDTSTKCHNASLYELQYRDAEPLGEPHLIATNLTADTILSIKHDSLLGRIIYLESAYGDAGCAHGIYTKVIGNTAQQFAEYSGCGRDAEMLAMIATQKRLENEAIPLERSYAVRVAGGTFSNGHIVDFSILSPDSAEFIFVK